MSVNERQELILKAQAKAELERRYSEERILFYKPCSSKHEQFHKSQKMARFFFGGVRSGKSVAGATELIFRACLKKHPFTGEINPVKGHFRIFTTRGQLIETHILPILKEWLPRKWLKGQSWKTSFNARNNIIYGASGTIIDILTYEQGVEATESVALDGVWADEEIPYSFYSSTLSRLISKAGKIWITVTPMQKLSWALKYWNNSANDPAVDVFKVSIYDNTYLNAKTRDLIMSEWPDHERDARAKGEFLEFKGLVFKELNKNVHFVEHRERMEANKSVVHAVDPHPRKATVMTWSYIDGDDLVFFDEMEIEGSAAQIVKAIHQREALHAAPTVLRIIDPAAKKQISGIGSQFDTLREFQDQGMNFSLAYNDVDAGISAVRQRLYYDSLKEISSFNRPTCYFTSQVPKTWDGMTNLMWDDWRITSGLKDVKEKLKDYKKDFPDCVRYTIAMRPRKSSVMSSKIKMKATLI